MSSFVATTTSPARVSADRHMSIVGATAPVVLSTLDDDNSKSLSARIWPPAAEPDRMIRPGCAASTIPSRVPRFFPLSHTEAVAFDSATQRRGLLAELPPFAFGPRQNRRQRLGRDTQVVSEIAKRLRRSAPASATMISTSMSLSSCQSPRAFEP